MCTYNGTWDTQSIDNSTRVHLYVEDDAHLMKHSGVDMMGAVQSEAMILPCQPTHPQIKVKLYRNGGGEVKLGKFVTFDPKVGLASYFGQFNVRV